MNNISLLELNQLLYLHVSDTVEIFEGDEEAWFEFYFMNKKFNLYANAFRLEKLGYIPAEVDNRYGFSLNFSDWIKLNHNISVKDIAARSGFTEIYFNDEQQVLDLIEFQTKTDLVYYNNYNHKTQEFEKAIYPHILLNDVFDYSTSDAERFELSDLPLLDELYNQFGESGLFAWAAYRRNELPIQPRQTELFNSALNKLKVMEIIN